MKNLFFKKLKKPFLFIPIALALISVAGLFWYLGYFGEKTINKANLPASPSGGSANVSSSLTNETAEALVENIEVLDKINYNNEIIPLLWTDNNDNENLIIKSDRQYYDAGEQTEVFFSITNTTEQEQQTDIYFWFDGEDKYVTSAEKINNDENSKSEILNPKQIPNSNPPAGGPNRKDIKGYAAGSKFQDTISANQTNYYRAIIKFPNPPVGGANGEFFIEAFSWGLAPLEAGRPQTAVGSLTGYGHLDPYYASGLVGMWSFSGSDTTWTSATAGTTNDLSGNNNTGTMTNMSRDTSPAPGISGQALNFDESNDYVNAGSQSSLDDIVTITISAWIYPESFGGGSRGRIVEKSRWGFFVDDYNVVDGINFWRLFSGTDGFWGVANSITLNQWSHVVVTYDNSTTANDAVFYINGIPKAITFEVTPTLTADADAASNLIIGGDGGTTRVFNGPIDEVRVYNRALSASEITDLYRLGLARLKANTPTTGYLTSGLVGNWGFNGQDTTWTSATAGTTNDLSGNNNTGAMTNMSRSTSPVPGVSGQALNFDEINDYVRVIDFAYGPAFSLAFWFNLSDNSGSYYQYVYSHGTVQVANSLNVYFNESGVGADANKIRTSLYDANSLPSYTPLDISTSGYIDSKYHLYTLTVAPNDVKVYIDEVLKASSASGGGSFNPATNIYLAARNDLNSSRFYGGNLDEVRIYNRALSASEIQDLYRLGAARLKANTPITKAGPQGGLVGNWTFNGQDTNWTSATAGTTNDLSGNNNTGTMTNMSRSTSPAPGISGQALDFDGSDDYVRMNSRNNLDVSTFTASVWINPRLTSNDSGILYNAKLTDAWNGWMLTMDSGSLTCNDGDICLWLSQSGGLYQYVDYAYNFPTNTWSHWIVTFDNSTKNVKFYVNGIQVYNTTSTYSPAFGATITTQIGMGDGTYSGYFSGLIDEVRVYNRVLSASEIQELYNAGARRIKIRQ